MVHIDSPVRPVQCPQCRAWCLLGEVDGFKVAVTATPLGEKGFKAALAAGLGVYGLSETRKLKRGSWAWPQQLLAHPCKAWADVPLKAPQRAVQRPCRALPGCPGGVASCQLCEPPPFDRYAHMFTTMLGATVLEVYEYGSLA